jgi:hypothetical protein
MFIEYRHVPVCQASPFTSAAVISHAELKAWKSPAVSWVEVGAGTEIKWSERIHILERTTITF